MNIYTRKRILAGLGAAALILAVVAGAGAEAGRRGRGHRLL